MTKNYDAPTAKTYALADEMPQIGSIVLTVVTKVYHPVLGGGAGTFGEAVDRHLAQCARDDQQVQSVELEISPDAWRDIVTSTK